MPIYEYLCRQCHKRSALLILNAQSASSAACRHCGSTSVERLMSRFSAPKSEEARLESLADPSQLSDIDESDPQSVARFMKKMGDAMGEDVGDDMESIMESGGEEDGGASSDNDSL